MVEFVFSQVLIDCLLRMKSNQRDKDELISCFKNEYERNNTRARYIFMNSKRITHLTKPYGGTLVTHSSTEL